MNIQKYFFNKVYTQHARFNMTEKDFISIYNRILLSTRQLQRGQFLKLCLMTSRLTLLQFSKLMTLSIGDLNLYFEGRPNRTLDSKDGAIKLSMIFGLPYSLFFHVLISIKYEEIDKLNNIQQVTGPKEIYTSLIRYSSVNSYRMLRKKLNVKIYQSQKDEQPLSLTVINDIQAASKQLVELIKGKQFEESLTIIKTFQNYILVNPRIYGEYTRVAVTFIIGNLFAVILRQNKHIVNQTALILRITQVFDISTSTAARWTSLSVASDAINYLHHGLCKLFIYSLIIAHIKNTRHKNLTISELLTEYGHILDKMTMCSVSQFIDLEAEYKLNRRLQNSSVKPDQDSIKQESQASVQDLETPEIVPEMSNSKDQAQIESDGSEFKQVIIQDQNIKLEKTESENDINKFEQSELEESKIDVLVSERVFNQSIETDQIEDYKPTSVPFKSIGYDQLIRSISNLIIMFDDDVDLDNMSTVNINQLNIILHKLDKIKNKMIRNISTKNISCQVKDNLTSLKESAQEEFNRSPSTEIPFQTPNMSIEELGMLSTMKNR